jgi:hypothetical protein
MGGCLCGWLAVLAGEAPAGVGALGPPPGVEVVRCDGHGGRAARRRVGKRAPLLYGGFRWFWARVRGGLFS